MDNGSINILINILMILVPIMLGMIIGSILEHNHFRSLVRRERELAEFPAMTLKKPPASWEASGASLVSGSVVISVDYFKRFIASLIQIFGGRIGMYDSLLERARREALLRMKVQAKSQGYDAVINVRLETSRLASAVYQGKGTAGLEILAFGTAIKAKVPR